MSDVNDFEVFEGKTFKELCKEIYNRSEKKKSQIEVLIGELRPFIHNINDALQIVPRLKEYLDVSVKNDDQLIKLATICQRLKSTQMDVSGADPFITEEEKEMLMQEIESVASKSKEIDQEATGSVKPQA